jgi:hypothetical protein
MKTFEGTSAVPLASTGRTTRWKRCTISRKVAELRDGRRVAGPPKSAAGVRVVALPAMLVDAMKRHLAEFPAEGEGLVFRGPLGAPLRRNNFHRSVRWSQALCVIREIGADPSPALR